MRAARVIALALLVSFGMAASAHAAFPGQNGRIAFYKLKDPPAFGDWAIWTTNSDGSGETQVTNLAHGMFAWNPEWSPDGTKILLEGDVESTSCSSGGPCDPKIYVINPDGSGLQLVTDVGDRLRQWPTWAPDGTRIAFKSSGEFTS